MLATTYDFEEFIREFEGLTLAKARWTHHAHLAVALWYLARHPFAEALGIVRKRIRGHNEAVGTANTDSEGYHETLTRLFLRGVAAEMARHRGEALPEVLAAVIGSPLGEKTWPLRFYTRERLFSVEARRGWVEPDLMALEDAVHV